MTLKLFNVKLFLILLATISCRRVVEETDLIQTFNFPNNAEGTQMSKDTDRPLSFEDEERIKSLIEKKNNLTMQAEQAISPKNKMIDEDEFYIEEVGTVRKLANTIENLIRKVCFFGTILFFNLSSGKSNNIISFIDYGMIALRGILAFVENSTLQRFYEEFLTIYITLTLFRFIVGNAMSLTNISTVMFTGGYSMWVYGAFIVALFAIPVLICYLLKEGKNFVVRRKIHKAILIAVCFYYCFFVFAPLNSLMQSNGDAVEFSFASILDFSYIVEYISTVVMQTVIPPYFIKALSTLFKVLALMGSSYLILKIYDCVININSSDIMEIVAQFYFKESVDSEDKTIIIRKRRASKN